MIICPKCQHPEMMGALFCSECGSRLDSAEGMPTYSFDPPVEEMADTSGRPHRPDVPLQGARVLLHLYQHDAYIRLEENKDYSLGRVNEGQTVFPDIDLSAYDGYKNGVSRVHASIQISPRRVNIVDLGSSNGTYLNGRRLTAQVPYSMSDGDILVLGKLESRVLVNMLS